MTSENLTIVTIGTSVRKENIMMSLLTKKKINFSRNSDISEISHSYSSSDNCANIAINDNNGIIENSDISINSKNTYISDKSDKRRNI